MRDFSHMGSRNLIEKWNNNDLKSPFLILEDVDYRGGGLKNGGERREYSAAFTIASVLESADSLEETNYNFSQYDEIIEQVMAKIIENTGPKQLFSAIGDQYTVRPFTIMNSGTVSSKRVEFTFYTHTQLTIKEELWQ